MRRVFIFPVGQLISKLGYFYNDTFNPNRTLFIMPSIILSLNQSTNSLQPFSLIRNVADIRMGFFTFRERWELISGGRCRYKNEVAEEELTGSDLSVPENALPDFYEFVSSLPIDQYQDRFIY